MRTPMQYPFCGMIGRRGFLKGSVAAGLSGLVMPGTAFAASGGILKVRSYVEADVTDPIDGSGVGDEELFHCIHRKLIQYKPGRKWAWQLDAAKTIEQIDGTHIAFALREGITFTNGFGEMTAEDVKFSFERIIDPDNESPVKPDWGPLSHVEVTGRYTGTIVLKEPFQPLWWITLPYIAGNIVSKKAVEEAGGRFDMNPLATCGPYKIKKHEPKQRWILERNAEFAGDPPAFDEIQIFIIDDEKTAEIAFEAGDIDFTRVSLSSLADFKANPPAGSSVEEYPSLYYVWLGMNTENPKLADPRVRKALQYSVDVDAIMQAAYFGAAKPSTGIIAPGLIGNRPQSKIPVQGDLDMSRKLLEEAGVSGFDVKLDVLNKSTWITAAQIIQANMAAIGVNVDVNVNESGAFWSLGKEAKGTAWQGVEMILNRFSMTPDPYYGTAWFVCDQVGKWNWERWCDAGFDDLHNTALGEGDADKRDSMYRDMQTMMEDSGAYRFITHEATPVVYRDKIAPALRPDGLPLYRYFRHA